MRVSVEDSKNLVLHHPGEDGSGIVGQQQYLTTDKRCVMNCCNRSAKDNKLYLAATYRISICGDDSGYKSLVSLG